MNKTKKGGTASNNAAHNTKISSANNTSSISLFEAMDKFQDFLDEQGLGRPQIKPDAGLIRFKTPQDKGRAKSGYYSFFSDGIYAASWGDWKSNSSGTWSLKQNSKPLTPEEKRQLAKKFEQEKQKRKLEQERKHAKARKLAHAGWNKALPAKPDHPYIVKKQIQGIEKYLRVDAKGNLIVPIYKDKRIVSLQYINKHGGKFFVKGSELKGSYYLLGKLKQSFNEIFICEGVSTGWTVHTLANQAPLFCAMNAGNLKAVALSVRKAFPDIKIIIAGDNDQRTDGKSNIGAEKAKEAAQAIGGYYSIPQFPDPNQKGDWNDLFLSCTSKGASNG